MSEKISYSAILGYVIKTEREARGITQAALSRDLNIVQSGLAKIERGETSVSVLRLRHICGALTNHDAGFGSEMFRLRHICRDTDKIFLEMMRNTMAICDALRSDNMEISYAPKKGKGYVSIPKLLITLRGSQAQ